MAGIADGTCIHAKCSNSTACVFATTLAADNPQETGVKTLEIPSHFEGLRHPDCEARFTSGDRVHFRALVQELFPEG